MGMNSGTYNVEVKRRAQRVIDRLPPQMKRRVLTAIAGLAEDPRPHGCISLTATEGYRIRVGNIRILYTIDDAGRIVVVVKVGNRRDVYDRRN